MTRSQARLLDSKRLETLSAQVFDNALEEFSLDDPSYAWYVQTGQVDVFLVELENGKVVASYKHVIRAQQGSLLFGASADKDSGLELRLKGFTGFRVQKLALRQLIHAVSSTAFSEQVDLWLEGFSESIAREVPLLPSVDAHLHCSSVLPVDEDAVVSSKRGVVWASTNEVASYLSTGDTGIDMPEFLPLCQSTWLTYRKATEVRTHSSLELFEQGRLLKQLTAFHTTALSAEKLNRQVASVDVANLQVDSSKLRDEQENRAREELARIRDSGSDEPQGAGSHLLQALKLIGAREKINFVEPQAKAPHSLYSILIASGVRGREVNLSSETNWWTGDNFSLLGFHSEQQRPVALVPGIFGRYRLIDPATGSVSRLSGTLARQLDDRAWMFYRTLPRGRATTRDVLSMVRQDLPVESLRFALSGILVGLCAFFPALAFGLFADWVLPVKSSAMLLSLSIALVFMALFGMLMTFFQSSTLLRAEARVAARLSASIWDRIIGLRPRSLHGFSAGELTSRAMVFQALRERASNLVTSSVTSVTFLFPMLLLLFFYDKFLAMVSLGVGLLSMSAIVALGLMQFKPQKRFFEERQSLAGTLFQFISGIGKLRTAGAEQSAFAFWVRGFVRQKQAEISLNRVNEVIVATTASIPLLASAVVFVATLAIRAVDATLGDFIVIYAASMMFFSATTRLGASVQALATVAPEFQQVLPLLERTPETEGYEPLASDEAEITLRGEVRFDHVSFAYPESREPVLDDVSIHVQPGEFVAIVGASGAGKSTLLNLALGLEQPNSGAIYYDNFDLLKMNRRLLRRQLGVVAQNGSLQPGTILQNITGVSRDLSERQAWQAAKKAAVDEDIRSMHMGLHTPVSDNSTHFSGGQVQRILIASALIREPRILFLDEATNWLDNTSQKQAMENIAGLAITRIVIAHRISAIRAADRIYVLDKGKIVQSGRFEQLVKESGVFRQIMARQL